MDIIYRRMYDYMHYILPQFSVTHINFQRIPLTDTSNPFCVTNIPTADQSLVMIHFLRQQPSVEYKLNLKGLIDGAMITGFNTLVIPGGKMMYAMELILTQRILDLMKRRGHLDRDDIEGPRPVTRRAGARKKIRPSGTSSTLRSAAYRAAWTWSPAALAWLAVRARPRPAREDELVCGGKGRVSRPLADWKPINPGPFVFPLYLLCPREL